MNKSSNAQAYCPFFIGDTMYSIDCESPYGTRLKITFKHEGFKNVHETEYCNCKNCENCEIYKATMTKYEENDNG